MIEISNLTKKYSGSDKKAVDGLSLTVNDGEIFGFLGPNGAGKSTTIKCLAGILPFSEGTIRICGEDIRENPLSAKRHLAYIADEQIVYEGLTGLQYINFIADVFGVDTEKRKERVQKYAERFDMVGKLKDKITSYSHGMIQKLVIIAALVHEPDVWILDEPMTGLDPKSSFELKKLMAEYAAAGKTVFFSSHVLEVVEKICSRVAIIEDGKLVTVCDMKDLQEKRSDLTLESLFLQLTETHGGNNE